MGFKKRNNNRIIHSKEKEIIRRVRRGLHHIAINSEFLLE